MDGRMIAYDTWLRRYGLFEMANAACNDGEHYFRRGSHELMQAEYWEKWPCTEGGKFGAGCEKAKPDCTCHERGGAGE